MAFKLIVLCAALACANAGLVAPVAHYSPASAVSSSYINTVSAPVAHAAYAAPVAHAAYAAPVAHATYAAPVAHAAYAAPVAAVHAPHYGATSQSVVRSLGGAQAVSHYSKAVDSAFSTVRKYDTRITNDGLSVHAAPVGYAAAPVAHAYAAPAYAAQTYAAPAYAAQAYAAPAYAAGPAYATVAKSYAAPVAHATYAAPVAHAAYAAPVAHAGYAHAPVVAKAAIAYSPAVAVSHTTFSGLGAHYEW